MKTVIIIRNGEIKMRVPNAEIINGVIRCGGNILINNDKITPPHTKESVAAAIKARKITAEIEALGVRIGDNGNGLVARWHDEYLAECKAAAEADVKALPAEEREAIEERNAISALYAQAYEAEQAEYYDTERILRLRAEADRRLKAWRANYPAAAKAEAKKDLLAKADKQEELARGAMLYDADGSISPAQQEQRRADLLAKAAEYRRQAESL